MLSRVDAMGLHVGAILRGANSVAGQRSGLPSEAHVGEVVESVAACPYADILRCGW